MSFPLVIRFDSIPCAVRDRQNSKFEFEAESGAHEHASCAAESAIEIERTKLNLKEKTLSIGVYLVVPSTDVGDAATKRNELKLARRRSDTSEGRRGREGSEGGEGLRGRGEGRRLRLFFFLPASTRPYTGVNGRRQSEGAAAAGGGGQWRRPLGAVSGQ